MAELMQLSPSEKALLGNLLAKSSTIDAIIPDTIEDSKRFLDSLGVALRLYTNLDTAAGKLKPVIGRMLHVIKNNPPVYKELGYANFEAFCAAEVYGKYGLSRASFWEAKRLYEAFPKLTLEEYAAAGVTKLTLAAKHMASGSNVSTIVEKAKALNVQEFAAWVGTRTSTNGTDRSGAIYALSGSRREIGDIRKFCSDPEIMSYCECSSAAGVILAMIAEVEQTWRDSIQEAKR